MPTVTPGYTFTGATDPITSTKLNLLSTPSVTIGNGEVVTATISDNAVTAAKLATDAVTTVKIAALAVTTAKIDALAVTTAKIDALAVTTAKIAANAVTPAKMEHQTGIGFLGKTTYASGTLSFVSINDGNIAWPTAGISISGTPTTTLILGISTAPTYFNCFKTTYSAGSTSLFSGSAATTDLNYADGYLNNYGGVHQWWVGNGTSTATSVMRIVVADSGARANIVLGAAAVLATNSTSGFPYIPTCAGTPTGTPTAFTGLVPMIFDTTGVKLWIYTGGAWKGVVVA